MIEDLIKALEKKGYRDARSLVKELEAGGALNAFSATKYLAREKVIVEIVRSCTSTTRLIEDAAYQYNISKKTLQDTLFG